VDNSQNGHNSVKYNTIMNDIKRRKIKNDLTTKRFGKLICIKPTGFFRGANREWLCICDCGNEHKVTSNHLVSGSCQTCGCSHRRTNKLHRNWKGFGEISGRSWREIQYGAKLRKLDFAISIEYVWQLFLKQQRLCSLTSEPISFARTAKEKKQYQTASLDRIDPTQGYIEGNVQWVHQIINFMKQDLNELEFLRWCDKVALQNICPECKGKLVREEGCCKCPSCGYSKCN